VHGDVHTGNILVNVLLPQYNADALEKLHQSADQARPLERLDGKKDLWAPPYLFPSASLRSCISTELDSFTKLTDIGEGQYALIPRELISPMLREKILILLSSISLWGDTGKDCYSRLP
jgi:hypothetical protein